MWYDLLITVIVLLAIFLIVASRVTKQTIPEMLGGITEWMGNRKEETEEKYMEIVE